MLRLETGMQVRVWGRDAVVRGGGSGGGGGGKGWLACPVGTPAGIYVESLKPHALKAVSSPHPDHSPKESHC